MTSGHGWKGGGRHALWMMTIHPVPCMGYLQPVPWACNHLSEELCFHEVDYCLLHLHFRLLPCLGVEISWLVMDLGAGVFCTSTVQ